MVLEKKVGETPLSCAEAWRAAHQELAGVPLAYAGRLDPMASGKLLVLVGEECKNQTAYHGLDKAYNFSVLFGIESDTQDVLGRLKTCAILSVVPVSEMRASRYLWGDAFRKLVRPHHRSSTAAEPSEDGDNQLSDWVRLGLAPRSAQSESSIVDRPSDVSTKVARSTFETRPAGEVIRDAFQKQSSQLQPAGLVEELQKICGDLIGNIKLPYPLFSAKTVQGKPLHMWTLEGRLAEIEIPTKESRIYSLVLTEIETLTREQVADQARAKIDTIPEVTDPRKALGADFRRAEVRADWEQIKNDSSLPSAYTIAHFSCVASSGTYMRTLASVIAKKFGTCGLAWHIDRTHIGKYSKENSRWDLEY